LESLDSATDEPDDTLAACCRQFPDGILDGRAICTLGIQMCANVLAGNGTGVDPDFLAECAAFCGGGPGNPGWCLQF
jgi:hypothetical protein